MANSAKQALVCMRCGAGLLGSEVEPAVADEPLRCEQCETVHAHETAPSAEDQHAHAVGDPILAEWGGRWWRAEILAQTSAEPERWQVRYLGWSDDFNRELGRDRVRDIAGGAPFRQWKLVLALVGLAVLGGAALLLANKGDLVSSEHTVPVLADTPLRIEQSIEVERDGVWMPAQILALNEDGSVRIRYMDSGLDSGTPADESVARARLRLP